PRIDRHRSRPHGAVLFPRAGGMAARARAVPRSDRHDDPAAAKFFVTRHAASARPPHRHSAARRDQLRARGAAGIQGRYLRAIYRRARARAATDAAGEAELHAHRPHFAALPHPWHGLGPRYAAVGAGALWTGFGRAGEFLLWVRTGATAGAARRPRRICTAPAWPAPSRRMPSWSVWRRK